MEHGRLVLTHLSICCSLLFPSPRLLAEVRWRHNSLLSLRSILLLVLLGLHIFVVELLKLLAWARLPCQSVKLFFLRLHQLLRLLLVDRGRHCWHALRHETKLAPLLLVLFSANVCQGAHLVTRIIIARLLRRPKRCDVDSVLGHRRIRGIKRGPPVRNFVKVILEGKGRIIRLDTVLFNLADEVLLKLVLFMALRECVLFLLSLGFPLFLFFRVALTGEILETLGDFVVLRIVIELAFTKERLHCLLTVTLCDRLIVLELLLLLLFSLSFLLLICLSIFPVLLFTIEFLALPSSSPIAKVVRQFPSLFLSPIFFPEYDRVLLPELNPLGDGIVLQKGWHLILVTIFRVRLVFPLFSSLSTTPMEVHLAWLRGCLIFSLIVVVLFSTKVVGGGLLSKRTFGEDVVRLLLHLVWILPLEHFVNDCHFVVVHREGFEGVWVDHSVRDVFCLLVFHFPPEPVQLFELLQLSTVGVIDHLFNVSHFLPLWAEDSLKLERQEGFSELFLVFRWNFDFAFISQCRHRLQESVVFSSIVDQLDCLFESDSFD